MRAWATRAGLLTAATAALVVLGACGPRNGQSASDAVAEQVIPAGPMQLLLEESEELEQRYDEQRAQGIEPGPEQIALLEEALQARRDYIEGTTAPTPEDEERLSRLESKLATAQSAGLQSESEGHEVRAGELLVQGRIDEAVAALREALRLQHEINAGMADAAVKRPDRETALAKRIRQVEVGRLASEIARLSVDAHAAGVLDDAARAESLLGRAIELQEQINREFSDLPEAGTARLEMLRLAQQSVGALAVAAERDRVAAQALARADAGDRSEAARLYARARELQLRINTEWPGSPCADPALPERYETLGRQAQQSNGP